MILQNKFGIHARILAAAMLVITATTCILGYFGLEMVTALVSQRFDRQIDYMAEHLANNAELGILIDGTSLLDGLARSVLDEKDVVGVEIEDSRGRLLAQQIREGNDNFFLAEKKVRLSRTEADGTDLEFITGGKDKEIIGTVRIKYTRAGIKNMTNAMAHRFIMLSLGLALAACLVFFLISRSLVGPVISLAEVARQISMGNRSLRARLGNIPETRRLAGSFNAMLDSLEQSRQELLKAQKKISRQEALAEVGKFSMMIAHEVKNPLAIIKSSLDLLKTDLNIPEDNLLLSYTEEELTRLNNLIENFLMFARPAKPSMISTDLNQLLEQVVLGFQLQYHSENSLDINCLIPDDPCMTEADNDLLARALSNIIKNACETSRHRGCIDINVKIDHNSWVVAIRDYGTGIDQKNLNKLFEPFFTTKAKGTGLGLAFTDLVVKAHDGTITACNHKKGGAIFSISLPLSIVTSKPEGKITNGTHPDR